MMTARLARVLLTASLALSACTTATTLDPTATGAPSPGSPRPTAGSGSGPGGGSSRTAEIWWVMESGGRLWVTPEPMPVGDADPGVAELDARLRGSPADPDSFGLFPVGAEVLDIGVEDGTAVVNWNATALEGDAGADGEHAAIQQVVYTLTALPDIERVEFVVEGRTGGEASNGRVIEDWWGHEGLGAQPFTRDPAVLAPITIDEPAEGATVAGSLRITGEATVFEATVGIRLRAPDGSVVKTTHATASIGAPGRGAYRRAFRLPAGDGETFTIEAFESSAEDGSDLFVVTRTIRVIPL